MGPRYIRPDTDYSEQVPNNPFNESDTPVTNSVSLQTTNGMVELGELSIVKGKFVVDNGNHDYGEF